MEDWLSSFVDTLWKQRVNSRVRVDGGSDYSGDKQLNACVLQQEVGMIGIEYNFMRGKAANSLGK